MGVQHETRRAIPVQIRWTALFDRAVGLPFDEPAHSDRKPSRRSERLDGAMRQSGVVETLADVVRKRGRERKQ